MFSNTLKEPMKFNIFPWSTLYRGNCEQFILQPVLKGVLLYTAKRRPEASDCRLFKSAALAFPSLGLINIHDMNIKNTQLKNGVTVLVYTSAGS